MCTAMIEYVLWSDYTHNYMKYIFRYTPLVPLLLVVFFMASAGALFAASWDGTKSRAESEAWKIRLGEWEMRIARWNEARTSKVEQVFGEVEGGREYCNARGCWSESLFSFTFTAPNGNVTELDKEGCGGTRTDGTGGTYTCRNGGQSIEFKTDAAEFWDSSNFGQTLVYKNSAGSEWNSGNFGQQVSFRSGKGESWKATNFGQTVEEVAADGTVFESSGTQDEEGTVVDDVADDWAGDGFEDWEF